jgi:hypothetical protein
MNIRHAAPFLSARVFALAGVAQAATPTSFFNLPTLTAASGNNQTQALIGSSPNAPGSAFTMGTATFSALSVKLSDGSGKPMPNVSVAWVCATSVQTVCQMAPNPNVKTITSTTNAQGIATLNSMQGNSLTAYYANGPIRAGAKPRQQRTASMSASEVQ